MVEIVLIYYDVVQSVKEHDFIDSNGPWPAVDALVIPNRQIYHSQTASLEVPKWFVIARVWFCL